MYRLGSKVTTIAAIAAVVWIVPDVQAQHHVFSGGVGLFGHCQCPPPYHHCMERPPRIRYHKVCPRPIAGPCDIQNYGYYQPCWRPWPFPPDWNHCPYITPASQVIPHTGQQVYEAPLQTETPRRIPPTRTPQLPPPRRLNYNEPPIGS